MSLPSLERSGAAENQDPALPSARPSSQRRRMSIADIQRNLSEHVRDYVDGRTPSLADALTVVAQPGNFRSILAELASNRALLEEAANRSVWHPNGFGKIILLSQPQYKLRLHVWGYNEGSPVPAQESIHNHRWDFAMIILAGSYRHQEFRPEGRSDGGEDFHAYTYCLTADMSSYSLTPTGTRTLRCVFDAHLSTGSRYAVSSEVLHRVIPDLSSPVVSLVLEGPAKPSTVEVFAVKEISRTRTTPFRRLPASYLIKNIDTVMSLPILG